MWSALAAKLVIGGAERRLWPLPQLTTLVRLKRLRGAGRPQVWEA